MTQIATPSVRIGRLVPLVVALLVALAAATAGAATPKKKTSKKRVRLSQAVQPAPSVPQLRFSSPFGPKSTPVYRVPYGYSNQSCANRSRFCRRCRTGGRRGHKGVDLAAPIGTKIYPVYRSVIDHLRRTDGGKLGRFIVLRFPIDCDKDAKTACLYATYAHLNRVFETVKKDQIVEVTTPLGETGISGNAKRLKEEQHHLHLEISTFPGFLKERIDPSLFMSITGNTPENNVGCRVLDGVMRKKVDEKPKKKTAKKRPPKLSVVSNTNDSER